MSRIHDALRKAEEERMGRSPSTPAGNGAGPLDVPADPWPVQELAPVVPAPSAPSAPPPEADMTRVLEARRLPWRPNLRECLPFHSAQRAGTEEFRTLRSRLNQMRERMALKRLLVSSAVPSEGKTFVALNLAQAFAQQHECRVLLLDCDLRRPRLHTALGAPNRPGVSEYLSGEVDEFAAIQQGQLNNIFFIPAGGHIENPGDLLSNGRLKHLLARLGPLFDWVVIDSPPVLPVSDGALISQDCDGVLMVVASGQTLCELGKRAQREFQFCPVVGAVLNRVPPSAMYNRYYGYYNSSPESFSSGMR